VSGDHINLMATSTTTMIAEMKRMMGIFTINMSNHFD
jgi:hypothetical protein